MSQKPNMRGICNTCIHRSGCLSLENSIREGKPIWHCEQFDDDMPITERERLCSVAPFVTFPGFSVKKLIPGWET